MKAGWLHVSCLLVGLQISAKAQTSVVPPVKAASPATASTSTAAVPGLFVDTASKLGVTFTGFAQHTPTKYLIETMGSGVATFDYDNDGLLDIFFVNGAAVLDPAPKGTVPSKTGPAEWNRLYHQRKDGSFEDVTEKAGLQGVGYGMGVAVGDYDNDGFEDLFVTGYGGNHLYHNNGNGTFTDVTEPSGTGGSTTPGQTWSTSAAWVDLDNDGLLDLVVLRYVKWDWEDVWCGEYRPGYRAFCHPDIFPAIAPLVYHNDGKGRFTEISAKTGLNLPGKGLGIALADFDRDGKIDIAIANDSMPEFLYHNKGNGQFEETGMLAEIAVDGDGRTYAGMGIDAQDYNNDGLPDLIITNLANQKYAMYRNNGDGSFTYDTYMSGLARMSHLHSGWGIHFFDYDNDGLKDFLVAQGHDLDTVELNYPQLHYKEPMMLAHNSGQGFVDVSKSSGAVFAETWVGRGLAVGDLDNDGRLDAVVSTNGGLAHILHNEIKTSNHWLILNLVGHTSNRDAIGAEIELTTSAGKQMVTVSTAGSYLSSNDKRAHFGLGPDTGAKTIRIRWPSGVVQVLEHIAGDQVLKIDEPARTPSHQTPK
ncbi:CRTAC1 family protein [Granulicella tundricola]|uniref:ASPIC/UnbV domain protein n=1 Tax=Granulicella tundricola (strain ATCC BAA-1859 / DSM 23138 / MP5ACTX9) TaxID=1198114 RepID=E8WZY6_GRATM|nr:CRTAC1 family protein [Granulicella tundricola]ADW68882.1 ASPIC/UnbV domain protein [Granulicella tundricola MP5ACTX9]